MDVVVRVLIGIPILFVFGWLWAFIFGLFVTLVNAIAIGLGRLLGKLFGVQGHWGAGLRVAMVTISWAKTGVTLFLWVSILWYAFLYPIAGFVAEVSAQIAAGIALMVWMPAAFLVGLFLGSEQP